MRCISEFVVCVRENVRCCCFCEKKFLNGNEYKCGEKRGTTEKRNDRKEERRKRTRGEKKEEEVDENESITFSIPLD